MKKYDVTAFGEVLIDFTYAGKNQEGKNLYEENVGGAPANSAAAVAKLGGKACFLGMTGKDSFGTDIKKTLQDLNVETKGMKVTEKQHTTLAFVTLDQNGERHFSFCRKPGADTQFSKNDLDKEILETTKILHVGSLSLSYKTSEKATLEAIKIVKKNGGLISYDPNWRENLWQGRKDALKKLRSLFKFADIVKISDEEMVLLFGKTTKLEEAAKALHEKGVTLVLITLGPKGVFYSFNGKTGVVGAKDVKVVDTTGAGDSFNGGLQFYLTNRLYFGERLNQKEELQNLSIPDLEAALVFANAVASLCVTKRGAIPALPDLKSVVDFTKI